MKRSWLSSPHILILPSVLFAALIIVLPLYQLGNISVSEVNRFGQIKGFDGLENYASIFSDPDFWGAARRTLIWTLFIVFGSIGAALPIAIALNQDFYGRGLARVIIMLPWAVSLTMTAIVWRWALSGESGMLNSSLMSMGIISENIQWLAQSSTAFPMQIMIGVIVTIPFTTTILLGGMSSIPDDLYEAGRLEGANSSQLFFKITLPLIRPFLNISVVLNTIYVFNSFPIIWVMTQGGPANSTDILVTYLYKLGFRFGRLGDASALSILMFAMLLVFTITYAAMAMRSEGNE